MANIAIFDLRLTGSELFSDDESYMRELSDGDFEFSKINGGTSGLCIASACVALITFGIGYYSGKHGCL
ncbi:MAG: hypothetical protein MUD14_00300 [Hydrococcus sp. Prado102]|jgi:hypothetical protein|nr:hypothetical protein [Hydrococcus sp. Prado102]